MKDEWGDSISKLVDLIIAKAIQLGSSDIHLEHMLDGLRVRYRIDGVLQEQAKISRELMLQVAGRIKVLARLDISERRIPQDGKFQYLYEQMPIDLRVSTFPGVYGEKFVIRILDQRHHNINLEQLGMSPDLLARVRALINRSHGLILVTGPTGSGKTTTLYAMIKELHAPEKNIITLEDPVEYLISGITQGQIYPKAGFSFAKGIRALLRQDPDVAMIGEVRDQESATIAIEAALTGHIVLTTLHTNDTASAIARLMDMGIEPFLINAALAGVLAQRLVRKLCQYCKQSKTPSVEEQLLLDRLQITAEMIYVPIGCDRCQNLGYAGRVGIFEFLELNESLRELIVHHPRLNEICRQGLADGMVTLRQDAQQKMQAGLTSLSEIIKAIH